MKPDVAPLEGPAPTQDIADLHAWAEGLCAGRGLDRARRDLGLFAGEGHIPLAADAALSLRRTDHRHDRAGADDIHVEMSVARVADTPRVTRPFSDEAWAALDALGGEIDADLAANDVRLTMGGEPTFVSIDDYQSPEWTIAALGDEKTRSACAPTR